jgi:epoxyqueuosine reductase QueG
LANYELTTKLKDLAFSKGACLFGVANPQKGFDKALRGHKPLDIMPDCRSVIVTGVATGTEMDRFFKPITHGNEAFNRLSNLFLDSILLSEKQFLEDHGHKSKVAEGTSDQEKSIPVLGYKVCAYEAGLGVYGRFGVIITKEYGPRVNWGVLLVDVELAYTGRLEGFEPCKDCTVCATLCPAKAIDVKKPPPMGHDRSRCVSFVMGLRDYYTTVGGYRGHCGVCFEKCPKGRELTTTTGFVEARQAGIVHEAMDKAVETARIVVSSAKYRREQAEKQYSIDSP